ncbi:MAG TPA: carbohydrate kinase [Chitinophagaceae bacterium]|nr:carbohydrate kinase [Chitinophagaceae bacterium]
MKKVLCLGEILLRLSPAANGQWLEQNQLPVFMGGAELNAATALAVWGHPVKYFTAMPDNALSKDIAAYLSKKNIDTSAIHYSGNRIGLYYLQQGTDMKNAGTVFDRAGSSFATLETGVVHWNDVLADVEWLHFSAIAPAVSATAAALCLEALKAASAKGIKISVDLNYRALLWKYGKDPKEVMKTLLPYCNLVMGNIWAANTLLGIELDETLIGSEQYAAHATTTANAIMQQYPACTTVANTFRFDEGKGIRYFAVLNKVNEQAISTTFRTDTVIDKVGSGDCFMAGLIHAALSGYSNEETINYAAAAAFGKLQEKGDTTSNAVDTIKKIITANG